MKIEQDFRRELKTTLNICCSDGCSDMFVVATAYIRDFTCLVLNFTLPNTTAGFKALSLFTECFVVYKTLIDLDLEKKILSLNSDIVFPRRSPYPGYSSFDKDDTSFLLRSLEKLRVSL